MKEFAIVSQTAPLFGPMAENKVMARDDVSTWKSLNMVLWMSVRTLIRWKGTFLSGFEFKWTHGQLKPRVVSLLQQMKILQEFSKRDYFKSSELVMNRKSFWASIAVMPSETEGRHAPLRMEFDNKVEDIFFCPKIL